MKIRTQNANAPFDWRSRDARGVAEVTTFIDGVLFERRHGTPDEEDIKLEKARKILMGPPIPAAPSGSNGTLKY